MVPAHARRRSFAVAAFAVAALWLPIPHAVSASPESLTLLHVGDQES